MVWILFSEGHGFSHAIRLRFERAALAAEGDVRPTARVHNFGTYFVTANCAHRLFQVERAAELFFEVLQHYREHYKLHAFVIMPDHIHLLITPQGVALERCLQLIKGGFSRRYRQERGSAVAIWQQGSKDHRCRDAADFLTHKRYIEQNPVRAGLCEVAEDFPWSSVSRRLRGGDSLSG